MSTDSRILLLVMPPQSHLLNGFASGLISLANFVKSRVPGIYIDILDLSIHSIENAYIEIDNHLSPFQDRTLFVGITTTTASYQSALEMARFVKQSLPQAVVVLGGHHASADSETVLRNHHDIVDLIVVGEGERPLYELLHSYPSLNSIPGLAFLNNDGRFTLTEPPLPLSQEELDSIPITYGDNGLIGTPGKFDHVTYVSARGCPLKCAFCAVGNSGLRAKSVSAVVRDIEMLLDMGFSRIAIEDNFFAHSLARTHELCKALAEVKQRRNNFTWDCQTRVESLFRKDTIALMAKAGCEAVYIGVESFCPEHLIYLNKTKNPVRYLQILTDGVIPALLDTGIACYLNLQFGLPGESEAHDQVTWRFLSYLGKIAAARGKHITVFPQLHVIYPGTLLFHQGVADGLFPKDIFESFTKWEFEQASILHWLGEHFAHGTGGIPVGIIRPEVLRDADFGDDRDVIDADSALRISAVLRRINRIRGVQTFNYGDYIITTGLSRHHKTLDE